MLLKDNMLESGIHLCLKNFSKIVFISWMLSYIHSCYLYEKHHRMKEWQYHMRQYKTKLQQNW